MRPVLYSFRRCPYAIRARCALLYAQIDVEHREIELRHKPNSMLQASPKGTVPVLITPEQTVIDQSMAIMYWALAQNDPQGWNPPPDSPAQQDVRDWVGLNDGRFKSLLDMYKYPQRHTNRVQEDVYQEALDASILPLNARLQKQPFLLGENISILDMALFPFVRQFVGVDPKKMALIQIPALLNWLNRLVQSELFQRVMTKYPIWRDQDEYE